MKSKVRESQRSHPLATPKLSVGESPAARRLLRPESPDLSDEEYRKDPLWTIPEFVRALPPTRTRDLAENHDHYLYGWTKR